MTAKSEWCYTRFSLGLTPPLALVVFLEHCALTQGSLGLAPPKQLDIAVPANLADGVMPVAAAAADDSKNAGGAVQQGAGALPAK